MTVFRQFQVTVPWQSACLSYEWAIRNGESDRINALPSFVVRNHRRLRCI